MKTTIGSNRLGGGKKMQVYFDGYERATFNLDKIVRTTASIGTLIPIYKAVALPEDTWDIGVHMEVYTGPTVGPVFGSLKGQIDFFTADFRLYNSFLHNNKLRIGNNISQVKFPIINLTARPIDLDTVTDLNSAQINPSSIAAYMGIRGIGMAATATERSFNAMPFLAYWEIYKQYYANLQENLGAVIHKAEETATAQTITNLEYYVANTTSSGTVEIVESPAVSEMGRLMAGVTIVGAYTGTAPNLKQVFINFMDGQQISLYDLGSGAVTVSGGSISVAYNASRWGELTPLNYYYLSGIQARTVSPEIELFDLENIDLMREEILAFAQTSLPYEVNSADLEPYKWIYEQPNSIPNLLNSQEGLAVKTYLNDRYNNWLETESIEYINNASAVTISGGKFTMDQLNFSQKMYDYLNRTAVAGGSYYDWLEAAYDSNIMRKSEMPVFRGGYIRNVVFQEVISQALSQEQPLATLGGIGRGAREHKGGYVVIKPSEPCYIMGILSFTPRIDYSQGNKWDMLLENMENIFKPPFNQIGFQDDINEGRAWWSTTHNGADWVQTTVGFLPAWIDYQTDVNEVFGNFATGQSQSFMAMQRNYEWEEDGGYPAIRDLTTYIDPIKYNSVFAQTSLDAQNLWVNIGLDIKVRRKMSAKIMPKV